MNTLKRLLGLALPAAVALVLAACDTGPQRYPRSTQTVVFTPNHTTEAVDTNPVRAVHVVLPGPEAGIPYVWEIGSNNNKVTDPMAPLHTVDAPSGRTTQITFYVKRSGKSVIRFFLVKPSLAETVPALTCEVTVRSADDE